MIIVTERGSGYLMLLSMDFTADRNLKTSVSISKTVSMLFIKIAILKYIWNLLTLLSRDPKLTYFSA